MLYRSSIIGLAVAVAAVAGGLCVSAGARADIYVTNEGSGTIGRYTTSGAVVNASLITGLFYPGGIAISGSDLFVANDSGTIGEYTTSGATVNASLVTGLQYPTGIAISGSDLFVTNWGSASSTIGEYTTSGATVNASLVTGLNYPAGVAVVPEPSALGLLSLGAVGILLLGRKHKAN